MLAMNRMTRTGLSLLCVMGLLAYAYAADAVTTFSGQYTADLEQKQTLLQSISEDITLAGNQTKENIESIRSVEDKKLSRLDYDHIDLAEIVPPTGKINLAFIGMSGTLSPKSAGDRSIQKRDASAK